MQLNQLLVSNHQNYTSNKQWKNLAIDGKEFKQTASVKAEARGDGKPHLEKTKSAAVQCLFNIATFRHKTLRPFQQLEFSHGSHYSYSNAKVKTSLFSAPSIF